MICTSKWRMPRTRLPASRTTANASGSIASSSSLSPLPSASPPQARAELGRLAAELVVGEGGDRRFERVDAFDGPPQLDELALVAVEQGLEKGHTGLQPFAACDGSSRRPRTAIRRRGYPGPTATFAGWFSWSGVAPAQQLADRHEACSPLGGSAATTSGSAAIVAGRPLCSSRISGAVACSNRWSRSAAAGTARQSPGSSLQRIVSKPAACAAADRRGV